MKNLLARLNTHRRLCYELIISSFFINLLALASPVFVIMVLTRYTANGVDGTLITLCAGIVVAIAFEFIFRMLRSRLANSVTIYNNQSLENQSYDLLNRIRYQSILRVSPSQRQQVMRDVDTLQNTYSNNSVTTLLDTPFAFLFLFMLLLLNGWLALITVIAIAVTLFCNWVNQQLAQKTAKELQSFSEKKTSLINTAIFNSDGVRSFNAINVLTNFWKKNLVELMTLKGWLSNHSTLLNSLNQSITALSTVAIYTVGAKLVVLGQMDIGVLIGANILGARCLAPISRLGSLNQSFARAQLAEQRVRSFANLPVENDAKAIPECKDKTLVLHDVAFTYPGTRTPLFESLSVEIPRGSLVVVNGDNGSGKTTLAKIILGLFDPTRGEVFCDDVNLSQINLAWWRSQVCYLPQELTFFNGRLIDNIQINRPELEEDELKFIIKQTDLEGFINRSQDGLESVVTDNAQQLAQGVKKRLALARALATSGDIVVLDEPMESLDNAGKAMVNQLIKDLHKAKKTIFIFDNNTEFNKQATMVVDLNEKPKPKISKK